MMSKLDDAQGLGLKPHLLLTSDSRLGLRTLDQLRADITQGHAAVLYERLVQQTDAMHGFTPYLPTSPIPERAPHHLASANREYVLVNAVVQRLKNNGLLWLLTREKKYREDAVAQFQAIFDDALWPSWLDLAHKGNDRQVDLRTGQLLAGIGYAYDWLHDGLDACERAWIIEQTDRRAIQPLRREIDRGTWFTKTDFINNWNTVILGGAGIAGMAFGDAHHASGLFVQRAADLMALYMDELGVQGEFNESVAYAGAMCVPIDFYAIYRYYTGGEQNHLCDPKLVDFCKWYMYFILPPGRSVRFGDCEQFTPAKASIFAAMAAATRDGIFQWFYLNHAQETKRSDVALELLQYDASVVPISPHDRMPLARVFHEHGALWSSRTDWQPDVTECVVYGKAGHGLECHGHHDAGQVCIDVAGQPMIVDLGHPSPSYPEDFFEVTRWQYYNASVRGHNVYMFNGREMESTPDAKARVLAFSFDKSQGGYWQVDTTALYPDVKQVKRTVVHLFPAIVVVLDDAILPDEQAISLRWHPVTACTVSAQGHFRVKHKGTQLIGCMQRLDGEVSYALKEHAYHAPYDFARGGTPLHQLHEPHIEAMCTGASCRMLTLFYGDPAGACTSQWEVVGGDWMIDTPHGCVCVSVKEKKLQVMYRTVQNFSKMESICVSI